MYKKLRAGGYVRLSDGAGIPEDSLNPSYQAVLSWIAGGGTPEDEVERPKTYRDKRMNAYAGLNALPGLGQDPGDVIRTLGDTLDIVIAELAARGTPATAAFDSMLGKIAAIKAKYPKE